MKKKKARPTVITIRLSEKEHEHFEQMAKKRGIAISQLVRMLVMETR